MRPLRCTPLLRTLSPIAILTLAACQPSPAPDPDPSEPERPAGPRTLDTMDGELVPPSFADCAPTTNPSTPEQWSAAALMHPFDDTQVMTSLTWYSNAERAMASSGFGVEGGGYDVLVQETPTSTDTYALVAEAAGVVCYGPLPSITSVIPTTDWVGTGADCVGEAPLIDTDTQWWKTDNDGIENGASWWWFTTDDARAPWRTMFAAPTDMAIFGQWSMTYFTSFVEAPSTPISAFQEICANPTPPPANWAEVGTLAELAALPRTEGQTSPLATMPEFAAATSTMPQIDYAACSNYELPTFPASFGMTTFMTPVNRNYAPYPTNVYFDSTLPTPSMRTRMFWTGQDSDPTTLAEDAMLIGDLGYTVDRLTDGGDDCSQNLPGIPNVNWMEQDHCRCAGIMPPSEPLSPGRSTMVISCPIVDPEYFWMWYTTEGVPVVFMETMSDASGTGLSLADYYTFDPSVVIDPSIFTVPSNCPSGTAETFHHAPRASGSDDGPPAQCNNCHNPVNDPWLPPR